MTDLVLAILGVVIGHPAACDHVKWSLWQPYDEAFDAAADARGWLDWTHHSMCDHTECGVYGCRVFARMDHDEGSGE